MHYYMSRVLFRDPRIGSVLNLNSAIVPLQPWLLTNGTAITMGGPCYKLLTEWTDLTILAFWSNSVAEVRFVKLDPV